MHEDARRDDRLGIESPEVDRLAHLHDRAMRRTRHDGAEIARRLAVDEITPPVGAIGPDQRVVGVDRILEHVIAPADLARLLAFRELRTVARRRVERADARARGANPLRQVALRHQLELDLARTVQRVEHPRVGLARKRADDLAHALRRQQRGKPAVGVARVVVHDGEIARALGDQRVDQLGRHPGGAEAADHDSGPVLNVGDGGGDG